MTRGAVLTHIGAIVRGVRHVSGENFVNLRVARDIGQYAGKATSLEIQRDRITARGFLDRGAGGQYVNPS